LDYTGLYLKARQLFRLSGPGTQTVCDNQFYV